MDFMLQGSKAIINLKHGSDDQSLACDSRGLSTIQGQSMWNLWWTKWHWYRFSPVSIIPQVLHTCSFIYHWCII